MNGLISFVTAFCAVCVGLGGIYILCPEGALSKPIKYLICLVFLCCILTAAAKLSGAQIDFPDYIEPRASEDDISAKAAELTFAEALRSQNVEFSKITVYTDKSPDGSISITEVVVYSSASVQTIKDIIDTGQYIVRVENE